MDDSVPESTTEAGLGSAVPPLCSITQVGDREWWCTTHKRNPQDCGERESPLLAAATRAVMRHFGYDEHAIAFAEDWRHTDSNCDECFDDTGKNVRHPIGFDDLVHTAETLRVGFEAVGIRL